MNRNALEAEMREALEEEIAHLRTTQAERTVAATGGSRSGAAGPWVLYTFPVRLAATYPDLWGKLQAEYRTATVVPGTVGGGDIVIMVNP